MDNLYEHSFTRTRLDFGDSMNKFTDIKTQDLIDDLTGRLKKIYEECELRECKEAIEFYERLAKLLGKEREDG